MTPTRPSTSPRYGHRDGSRSQYTSRLPTPPMQDSDHGCGPASSGLVAHGTASHPPRTLLLSQEPPRQDDSDDSGEGGAPALGANSAASPNEKHPPQAPSPKKFLGYVPVLLAQAWQDAVEWSEAHSVVSDRPSRCTYVLVSGRYGPYGESILIYAIRSKGMTMGYILYDADTGAAFTSPSLIGVIHKYRRFVGARSHREKIFNAS